MAESNLRAVRGMSDLLPPDSNRWRFFEHTACQLFSTYGYREIRLPLVEPTELFARGIGETTDIVEKEMYTFNDRKNRSLTLRPEGTASCARAYIQHNLHKREPVTQWFYSGPMYRYERMQVGRYRQFYQIGVEVFGVDTPTIEAEQIAMLNKLYHGLGITQYEVVINSVGERSERPAYRDALVDFLALHTGDLCTDCQRRLATNPLRILDCKEPHCQHLLLHAPSMLDYLSPASRQHFTEMQNTLHKLGVRHRVDHRMVRGLDYYTGPVFELISTNHTLGTQDTLVAGGRYNNLIADLGGPQISGVGFALGLERSVLSLPHGAEYYSARPLLFLAAHGDAARQAALSIASELRAQNLLVAVEHRAVGLKAQYKRADKLRARFAATLGDDELASGSVWVRALSAEPGQKGISVAIGKLAAYLRSQLTPLSELHDGN